MIKNVERKIFFIQKFPGLPYIWKIQTGIKQVQ